MGSYGLFLANDESLTGTNGFPRCSRDKWFTTGLPRQMVSRGVPGTNGFPRGSPDLAFVLFLQGPLASLQNFATIGTKSLLDH